MVSALTINKLTLLSRSPSCWILAISIPVAIAILWKSPQDNDRGNWRKRDWPLQLGHVFHLIIKSLLCWNYFYWQEAYPHATCQFWEVYPNSSFPDFVVIRVTIMFLPSPRSTREMVSHCLWMSVDPYLWQSFLLGKMNIQFSVLKVCLLGRFRLTAILCSHP